MRLFSDVTSRVTDPFLARAASLAEQARGAAAPNPLVGCVVVRKGNVVGEGFHHKAGQPHAEILALQAAGDAARGATVYVTLEPCAHTGKTPPCTDALVAAGVARVVIGMRDPNAVAGGGAGKLRDAGIEVQFAEDPAPFEELNAGWLHRVRAGRPLVTVKLGLSLDARPAFALGKRASITGPSGATITQRLRAATDAVLVSAATVIADDPALTVRDAAGRLAERQPLRVVLVCDHVPQAEARVFTDEAAPTLVLAVGSREGICEFIPASVDVHECSGRPLVDAFTALAERGIGELLVEPGSRLFSSLWVEGLVDRLVVVTAGGVAGDAAPSLFLGEAQQEGSALVRRMAPVEAGIVEDVSVTVWQPVLAVGEE
ncbi:MAG: bifunctional diaminohydroxyphosphoribosylaminopyrimidine deaminase/5-amino-6-(5-phosphoribosylamino)uracil reductase RibD [Coriobacteriia bacterium]|nr:bifunctional diaminohydroxyphosphoribosylaminopyrimidine deaminase/5-amino-6-(5-phosphoribosylamino)uracil reductase RibD [Coriobacteriia bacterium]